MPPLYYPPTAVPVEGRNVLRMVNDFCDSSSYDMFQATNIAGGTSTANPGTATAGHLGLWYMASNTTLNTGTTGILSVSSALFFGQGSGYLDVVFTLSQLSTTLQTFTSRIGFLRSIAAATEPQDGCFIRYTHSVNGGNWQFVTRANNSETAVDTGIAADTAYHRMRITFDAAGSTVNVSFDGGAPVATITTNIPAGTSFKFGVGAMLDRTVGASNLTLYVDMIDFLMYQSK